MLVVLVCITRCYTCCTLLCFTGNIVPDSTRLSCGSPCGDVNQITQTSLGALHRYGSTLRLVVDHYKMTSSVVCHDGFWQCEDDVMPWVPVEEHRKITSFSYNIQPSLERIVSVPWWVTVICARLCARPNISPESNSVQTLRKSFGWDYKTRRRRRYPHLHTRFHPSPSP